MNAQQRQLLQSVGISPDQIEAIQAQARAAPHGHGGGYGQPSPGMNTSGRQQYTAHPSDPSQPINLTIGRDASGGFNISGLENLQFVQAPNMMQNDNTGGTIKISSSFKDVHGMVVSTIFIIPYRP